MQHTVLGLITARGGSKGIARKNLAPVGGKPMIAWSIEAARAARGVDRVVVSTDDTEIAEVSRRYGAEVPFVRPADLAQDDSSHLDVILHCVDWLAAEEKCQFEYVMLLQPTSPLRTAEDIDAAAKLAVEENAESVISVCETHHHPYLTTRIADDGTLTDFMSGTPEPGTSSIRRQDMPVAYFINGAIYLVRNDVLLEQRTLLPARTLPYLMPQERSWQVDEPADLRLVDWVLRDRVEEAPELEGNGS
jgi:CMP-N,N'-diacetyllegionaminic acid synthase